MSNSTVARVPNSPPPIERAPARPAAPVAFHYTQTDSFAPLLAELGASLAVSTYQANKLLAVRACGEGLSTLVRTFERPMSLAVDGNRLALGTCKKIWMLRNAPDIAPRIEPEGMHDGCFLPRSSHVTGDIGVHELAWASDELWIVSTRFSCLATLDPDYSFVPRWRPPFISALAADLNGDPYDDFVTHNSWYGYVTVLTGDSSGFLQGPTGYFYTGDNSYEVSAGDLNGDGDNDLVTANISGNSVGVLLGDGAGGLSEPVNYATGGYPASLVLGDFTGDGNLDVATANDYSHQVAVLHGTGDGAFSLPVLSAAGAYPWSIAAGDFNGDGWLDAATANAGSSDVSVLINDHSWPVPVPPSVIISDVTKSEGQRNKTAFSFTVSLSEPSSHWVTVSFATADGTATTADNDYYAASGTISFAPGTTTATITVWVRGDKKKEADETFFLNLTDATGATIDDSQGLGTITSDDGGKGSGKGPHASLAAALDADTTLTKAQKRK